MKILLGKIGQKVIFDRSSKDCDRSNTNGNVGTYLLMKLLIENNKDDEFYVISKNDLSSLDEKFAANVFDASEMTVDEINAINPGAMFILTGLMEYETDNRFIEIVNKAKGNFILLSDDPRCLDSVNKDERICRFPDFLVSQFEGAYNFKGRYITAFYEPIERASCYGHIERERDAVCKEYDMIVVSNTSGDEYNRPKIVSQLLKGTSGIRVYGRLSEEEVRAMGDVKYIGEIKYNEMQSELRAAKSTLLVPIKKGWVTSKYVEAVMNGAIPIFYEDYNTKLIGYDRWEGEFRSLIVVSDDIQLRYALNAVRESEDYVIKFVCDKMYDVIVSSYVDGKKLSDALMKYAKF